MRIYLPSTTSGLAALLAYGSVVNGSVAGGLLTAFAVTPGLREWYVDDDEEELEYAAMSEAARASLRLVDADPSAARRRVVVAADVPDDALRVRDDLDRGVVHVEQPIELAQIASVHVDDRDAEGTVAAAATAVLAADLGDAAAQETMDDAEGHELSWYASQEIAEVLGAL